MTNKHNDLHNAIYFLLKDGSGIDNVWVSEAQWQLQQHSTRVGLELTRVDARVVSVSVRISLEPVYDSTVSDNPWTSPSLSLRKSARGVR